MMSFHYVSLSLVFALLGTSAVVQEGGSEDGHEPAPAARQRLDFGTSYLNTPDGHILTGGLNYSWAPLDDHSFAFTLPIVDAGLANSDASGIGDLLLRYNWTPGEAVTANPWVPTNLGTGVGLLLPTGDAEQGLGQDQWVIAPTLGLIKKLGRRTSLLPQLQYFKSFAEGELAPGTNSAALAVGLLHLTKSRFWVQYTPSVSYDLDSGANELDNQLVLGQQLTRRFSLALEGSTLNSTGTDDEAGREVDYQVTFKLSWVLGY